MAKTKTEKQNIIQEIVGNLKKQKSLLFIDYKGIGVKDLSTLRKQLKEVGAKLTIAKKTLFSRAFKEQGIESDFKKMEGQIALVYSFEDSLAGIKATHTFAKGRDDIKLLGGYMENQMLDTSQVKELALLPSKEQLLGQFIATLASPMRGLVTVFQGNIKGLIITLSAIKEKKI